MNLSFVIAGSGGQGILFLGKLLAQGVMDTGKNVTWFPSYGPEMRGGTANCTVVISDSVVGSPIVRNPDVLIVMNEASLLKFQPRMKKGGLLIFDSSLIKKPALRDDIRAVDVPASALAAELGNSRSANMVMFGAAIGASGVLDSATALIALEELTPPERMKTLKVNKKAVTKGLESASDKKN